MKLCDVKMQFITYRALRKTDFIKENFEDLKFSIEYFFSKYAQIWRFLGFVEIF